MFPTYCPYNVNAVHSVLFWTPLTLIVLTKTIETFFKIIYFVFRRRK